MTFDELNEEQLQQLAERYLIALADEGVYAEVMGVDWDVPSYGEIAQALSLVPHDVLAANYDGIEFTEDDFFQGVSE